MREAAGVELVPGDSDTIDLRRRAGDTVLQLRSGSGSPRDPTHGGAMPPDWPVAAWLSKSDLRPRVDIDVPLLRPEVDLEIAPKKVLGWRTGGGTEFNLQLDPRTLEVDAQPYLRYIRWRFTRVLTQVLADLGARFPADTLGRFTTRPAATPPPPRRCTTPTTATIASSATIPTATTAGNPHRAFPIASPTIDHHS